MDSVGLDKTSFIPKKALETRSPTNFNFAGLFLFFSIAVFILSLGGYFAAYFYEKKIVKDVEDLRIILKRQQDQFQPNQVANMVRFDSKIKTAKDLLYLYRDPRLFDTTEHVTLKPLFEFLSRNTLKSVRFKDFKYNNVDNQKIEISMAGEAKGYASVALQAKAFSEGRQLTNIIFSDLNIGSQNNVVFNMSALVKPELISYAEMITNQ